MSILTKICIVVLVVLILLACPIFISQATEPENWRYKYDQEVKQVTAAMASAGYDKLMLLSTIRRLQAAKEDLDRVRNDARRELAGITFEKATLETKFATLQGQLEIMTAQLAALTGGLNNAMSRSKQLEAHLLGARKTSDKQAQEIIRLDSELRDLMSQNDRLTAAERVRVERIYELDEELAKLKDQLRQAGIRPGETPDAATAVTGATITGEITIVRNNLASINIGSANGVVKGMEMTIYRGGNFVGTIRIEDVSVVTSAGVIIFRNFDPVKGDKVTNKLTD